MGGEKKRKSIRGKAEFVKFVNEFSKESDRAAVVLGAAKLDLLLYQILQNFLLPSASRCDELLEGDAPLGTFSARISAAFRMGLINAELCRALHMVRKIRNAFAHETEGCSLEGGAHRDRVKELIQPFRRMKNFDDMEEEAEKQWGVRGGSLDFRLALAGMVVGLERYFHKVEQIVGVEPCPLIPLHLEPNED